MSKRFDNKRLLFLLAGLIALLLLTIVIKIPKEKATLKSSMLVFDTLDVNKIIIYPRGKGSQIDFFRNSNSWSVQQGTVISATQKGAVQNLFKEVLSIKPQSLATLDKSKWKEFELTDSLATRVKFVSKKGKILGDLMIGKFSYKQVNDPYRGSDPNNIQGTSFIKLSNEKEVYAVDGFISFLISGKFDDWRDKTLIDLNKNDILNITFTYPSDSSFKLLKNDMVWYEDNQKADSLKIADYINSLSLLDGEVIKDNYKPVLNPSYQLSIDGNNLLNVAVKCYKDETTGEYILNSSQNPAVFFSSKGDGIFAKLFKPRSNFLK